MRRVRDGDPLNESEQEWVGTNAGWMVDGSPDQLIERYNEMIGAYNSLRW